MKTTTNKLANGNTDIRYPRNYRLTLGLENLKSGFKKLFYHKGQILIQEGNAPEGLYYLEEGQIKLYRHGRDGQEQIFKIAHAGDFIGFSTLLKDGRYNYSASIIEDAILAFIPKQDFLEHLANDSSSSIDRLFTRLIYKAAHKIALAAPPFVKIRLAEQLPSPCIATLSSSAKQTLVHLFCELGLERSTILMTGPSFYFHKTSHNLNKI